jgi:hypothetical protein
MAAHSSNGAGLPKSTRIGVKGAAPLRDRCRRFRCLAPRMPMAMLDCGHIVGAQIPRWEQNRRELNRRAQSGGSQAIGWVAVTGHDYANSQ